MRLHQPVGIGLLLWPCLWSLALAGGRWRLYAAFALGAVCMRGAGCIINDLWDRKVDAQVERTRTRPLASGEISVEAAVLLLGLLLLASWFVAGYLHIVLWSAAALPLVATYPFMKRIIWWPQAFLGLTFNWGALLGAVAVCGHVTLPALLLYAGGIGWTLGYDTIYAHQDTADDARVGVKSTALRLHGQTKHWLAGFYGFAVACWALAGIGMDALYFAVLIVVAAHFACQIRTLVLDDPASCLRVFKSNAWLGLIMFAACMAGKMV